MYSIDEAYKLFEDAINGNRRAIGKLLTLVESPTAEYIPLLQDIISRSGNAHIIGITGVPGAGKSTLISRLITELRKKNYRIAVIAIDPSSPFTSGAFLGDRLRMQKHATDENVFIRSLASRGLKGGLSLATLLTLETFDALGYDKIIIETVGAGQVDVDVFFAAMTILVVTLPAAGDEIQALKAGLMEIGDIYVVNKADKLDADEAYQQLKFALEAGELHHKKGWKPKVIKASAVTGLGMKEIVESLDEHFHFLKETSELKKSVYSRREHLTRVLLYWFVEREIDKRLESTSDILEQVKRGEKDPITAAIEAYKRMFQFGGEI